MGNCIICGKPTDGLVCESHEEDVLFEFEGSAPSHLSPNRYYRGTVDGYADFGVFIDIGDHVTGLLHRSELDRRLESLDWEPGDTVYVQVLDIRDNGNVDLGWSIRQREREFRGKLIETADDEFLPEEYEGDGEQGNAATDKRETASDGAKTESESGSTASTHDPSARGPTSTSGSGSTATTSASAATSPDAPDAQADSELNRTTVDVIEDQVGSLVRLEGEITGVRQTSGPTVFELRDETGTVECAAFEEAGVRAYPDVELDDIVALEGDVERRRGELQIETERLEILDGEKRDDVVDRLDDAITQEARPPSLELLADHDSVSAVGDQLLDAATALRRAVIEARPIVVRHSATADGYVAGAAIERAVLPLIREKHTRDAAEYHYFERRPLEGRIYDVDAATGDIDAMLEARDRHGEQFPLVVVVDAGSTIESADGYDLLDIYGADRIVIDDSRADEAITEHVSLAVAPSLADADTSSVTSTVLAVTVAAHVNGDVRGDLEHLPAVSYWEDTPDVYTDLAREAEYDETAITERREAVALEAYYQSYKDKRELIADLLFDGAGNLAAHVSEQFRDKLETELETARENVERVTVDDTAVTVLDTNAFTHRFDFPTTDLLLDELHRREREHAPVTIGIDDDELRVRSEMSIDVRELGAIIEDVVPEAGSRVVGGHDGHVEFFIGERDAVREATLEALGDQLE